MEVVVLQLFETVKEISGYPECRNTLKKLYCNPLRRVKLLSSLFEELKDGDGVIDQDEVRGFVGSRVALDSAKELLRSVNEGSKLYQAHKEAKKVRGKIFPYYGDLAIIIGNDQATGDRCIASRDDDNVPMVEASESVHTNTGVREDVASGFTTSSRKRMRTCDNDDPEFAKAISSICKAFEQASAMPIRLETFPWQEVEKAVRAVPGLTKRQILKIMRKFNGNIELGTFFLGLTEKTREGWVLAELEDN